MRLSIPTALCAFLVPASVMANPMWSEMIRAQLGEGHHVQITYAAMMSANPEGKITTYGTSQSPWTDTSSISTDTGSGVKSLSTVKMCDCHVPTSGILTYSLPPGSATPYGKVDIDPTQTPTPGLCVAECELADHPDAGSASGTGGAIETGGSTAASGATSQGDGGCTWLPQARSGIVPAFLLLAGLTLVVRRRRRM